MGKDGARAKVVFWVMASGGRQAGCGWGEWRRASCGRGKSGGKKEGGDGNDSTPLLPADRCNDSRCDCPSVRVAKYALIEMKQVLFDF